jgi:hypothetical protein
MFDALQPTAYEFGERPPEPRIGRILARPTILMNLSVAEWGQVPG